MFRFFFRLACIGLVVGWLASCALLQQAIKEPKVAFESFRLGETSAESLELIPRLAVTNLNNFPIPLDGIGYKLQLNGRNIFDGAIEKLGELKPNKAKSVDIPVRLSSETLDFFVNSLLEDKQISYAVAGNANIKGISVPFDRKGNVFLPEVKLGQVDFSEVSLSNISANLPIQIVNKNEFDLPFNGLQYSVSNKGQQLFANSVEQQGIAKGAVTNISVPFELNPSNLVTSAVQLLQNPTIDLDLQAIADFGFAQLPFSRKAPVKLR